MSTMTAPRVEFDDCEYSDAQQLLHEGEPYTGTVVETAAGGRVCSEQNFRRGIPHGTTRIWRASGQLAEEAEFDNGLRRRLRRWHANGQLQHDITYDERARVLTNQAWNEQGEPVDPAR